MKLCYFEFLTACIGALARSTLMFVFFIGTESDPGYYKQVCPGSVSGKLIKLKKKKILLSSSWKIVIRWGQNSMTPAKAACALIVNLLELF